MKLWYSISDLLELKHPDLPTSRKGMLERAKDRNWDADKNRSREANGNGGTRMEYHIDLLPILVSADLKSKALMEASLKDAEPDHKESLKSEALWLVHSNSTAAAKETAAHKLKCLQAIQKLETTETTTVAMALVSFETDVPTRTLYRWQSEVTGVHRNDWLAALVPTRTGGVKTASCDRRAWDMLVSDYMRPEQPSFTSCFRRMEDAATASDWSPIPSSKTLKRRIEKEFDAVTIVMARKGKGAATALYPAQTRDRSHYHALEAVNADGHVFDVFVRYEDGTVGRPCMIGFQDLYSGLVLSHRISKTENKETTRLAIADMVESWGIPEHVYFDNGRAFMSKWITGGMKFRYRFKVKQEEPQGILTRLNVHVHAVTPYHGQSKPIERAWRDMATDISRHPKFAGAYVGNKIDAKPENYGSRAIPIEDFRKVVAQEIMRHNTRTGRRSAVAAGRSFAETYKESAEKPTTLIRKATEMQRQFFLLAGEGKTARRGNGEIHLADNRYWSPNLVNYAGKKLMIRFDPENLHDDLFVYTMDGRYIDKAPCIEAVGFDNAEAAREHAKLRRQFAKAHREVLRLGVLLTPQQVADKIPDPEPIEMPDTTVVGMISGNRVLKPQAQLQSNPDDDAAAFARGLTQIYPRSDE